MLLQFHQASQLVELLESKDDEIPPNMLDIVNGVGGSSPDEDNIAVSESVFEKYQDFIMANRLPFSSFALSILQVQDLSKALRLVRERFRDLHPHVKTHVLQKSLEMAIGAAIKNRVPSGDEENPSAWELYRDAIEDKVHLQL